MREIDILVNQYIASTRTPLPTEFMYVVTTLFDVSIYFMLVIFCVALLVYLVRNIKYSILFLFSLTSSTLIVLLLKSALDVARPIGGVITAPGQSFPSFHATISAVFFIMLMYIFDDYFSGAKKRVFNTLCVTSLFLVSVSRVYLGVHWVSDVTFGIVLGLAISYVCIYMFKKYMEYTKN